MVSRAMLNPFEISVAFLHLNEFAFGELVATEDSCRTLCHSSLLLPVRPVAHVHTRPHGSTGGGSMIQSLVLSKHRRSPLGSGFVSIPFSSCLDCILLPKGIGVSFVHHIAVPGSRGAPGQVHVVHDSPTCSAYFFRKSKNGFFSD